MEDLKPFEISEGYIPDTRLKCSICKESKEREQFYNHKVKDERRRYTYRCKECYKAYNKYNRRKKYGVSREDFEGMRWLQDNKCALCECEMTEGGPQIGTDATVDHDHNCCPGNFSCGKCIRGLLCRTCNGRLGNFETLIKNPRLISYLNRVIGLQEVLHNQ